MSAEANMEVYEEICPDSPEEDRPIRVAFVGSECYPFVKTGGLGDVMYALPRALPKENCEIRVFLPMYGCIAQKWKDRMEWKGSFMMDLTLDGREFFVGIMELEQDGVIYDFIDNQEFFSWGNPYTGLWEDIPKYCYFSKAVLAVLNYMEWIPDVIHCHDWQAALVPVYLRTRFEGTPVGSARSILTIHNLRFQGRCSVEHLKYWSGLDESLFNYAVFRANGDEANMFKGGLAYADRVTTVSETYAQEIQTDFYGEGLNGHLWYHREKLLGIVNGIDVEQWNSRTDTQITATYSEEDVVERKKENKVALQKQMGLNEDPDTLLIGLVSRLTDQKGLDLINTVFHQIADNRTQVIILGTGDSRYEDAFRYYEGENPGRVRACITYNEALSHQIYASSDALMVPSLFEPCGLTQLIAMRYGTVPIVRETGGLKDTVLPYNQFTGEGNGFTFDHYKPELLLDAVRRARDLYYGNREGWDAIVRRDMEKDVSWENSARQYMELYASLKKMNESV